ncbi:MAG: carboxymuconolactone decarboxylase family protein [Ferrovibrio sp.]
MTLFPVPGPEGIPPESQPRLARIEAGQGRVLNLYKVMAIAPALLEGYVELARLFSTSSLTLQQQQVVLFATNRFHGCAYCVAGHSAAALRYGVPDELVTQMRDGAEIDDPKLEALRRFTLAVLQARGAVTTETMDEFVLAGHTPRQALEVIVGIAAKVLSNYANHFASTPLDPELETHAWKP